MNIFEYGCGFSTLFYAQKQCTVYSVETNDEWSDKISTIAKEHNLAENINIKLCKPHEVPQAICEYNTSFNIIIVDSLHRIECLKNAKEVYCGGIIILDNSERENLQTANNIMSNFEHETFEGEGVNRSGTSQATVFWKNL